MEKLKSELLRIRGHKLEYYSNHLDVIENHIDDKPDISIETCKSLIEGISKLTLHVLKQEPLSELDKGKRSLQELFKSSLNELQKGRGFCDVGLCNRLGAVVHYIGELRNAHGDISHGRASLKEQLNDADFAELISRITESICIYMLKRLEYRSGDVLEYEDNPDFNIFLDENNPLDGKVLYSKALFDQELETYEIELENFKARQEEEAQNNENNESQEVK